MIQPGEAAYWLALAYSTDLKLTRLKDILADWYVQRHQPLSALFELSPAELEEALNLSETEAAALQGARQDVLQQEAWLQSLSERGITVLTRGDIRYPPALVRALPFVAQPLVLFCRGNLERLGSLSVAIAGAQDASDQAIDSAQQLAAWLAEEGVAVMSGLGKGVGRAAFRGALTAEPGGAVAVLPMGIHAFEIDAELAAALEHGQALLLSPFHPNARFDPAQALARNRLIVGLSDALLVMQAGEAGVERDMADEALRMGKGVYVWEVDSTEETGDARWAGHPSLVQAGALPVSTASDILDMVEALKEMSLERTEAGMLPTLPTQAAALEHSAGLSPQATLELLSRAGRVPEVLLRRLGAGDDD
jgi:DNA processing protein